MLSMHELSLSMPEPMLSLSMLILATYPVAALEGTIRNPNQTKSDQNQAKSAKVVMLKFGMSVLTLVSNGDVQRSNRICSQDQLAKIDQTLTKIMQNHLTSPKVNMLKFGGVSFDLGFEW